MVKELQSKLEATFKPRSARPHDSLLPVSCFLPPTKLTSADLHVCWVWKHSISLFRISQTFLSYSIIYQMFHYQNIKYFLTCAHLYKEPHQGRRWGESNDLHGYQQEFFSVPPKFSLLIFQPSLLHLLQLLPESQDRGHQVCLQFSHKTYNTKFSGCISSVLANIRKISFSFCQYCATCQFNQKQQRFS